jgi:hypothetical protein
MNVFYFWFSGRFRQGLNQAKARPGGQAVRLTSLKFKVVNAGVVIHMVFMVWQLTVIRHVVEMQMIIVVVNMQTLSI